MTEKDELSNCKFETSEELVDELVKIIIEIGDYDEKQLATNSTGSCLWRDRRGVQHCTSLSKTHCDRLGGIHDNTTPCSSYPQTGECQAK